MSCHGGALSRHIRAVLRVSPRNRDHVVPLSKRGSSTFEGAYMPSRANCPRLGSQGGFNRSTAQGHNGFVIRAGTIRASPHTQSTLVGCTYRIVCLCPLASVMPAARCPGSAFSLLIVRPITYEFIGCYCTHSRGSLDQRRACYPTAVVAKGGFPLIGRMWPGGFRRPQALTIS